MKFTEKIIEKTNILLNKHNIEYKLEDLINTRITSPLIFPDGAKIVYQLNHDDTEAWIIHTDRNTLQPVINRFFPGFFIVGKYNDKIIIIDYEEALDSDDIDEYDPVYVFEYTIDKDNFADLKLKCI